MTSLSDVACLLSVCDTATRGLFCRRLDVSQWRRSRRVMGSADLPALEFGLKAVSLTSDNVWVMYVVLMVRPRALISSFSYQKRPRVCQTQCLPYPFTSALLDLLLCLLLFLFSLSYSLYLNKPFDTFSFLGGC